MTKKQIENLGIMGFVFAGVLALVNVIGYNYYIWLAVLVLTALYLVSFVLDYKVGKLNLSWLTSLSKVFMSVLILARVFTLLLEASTYGQVENFLRTGFDLSPASVTYFYLAWAASISFAIGPLILAKAFDFYENVIKEGRAYLSLVGIGIRRGIRGLLFADNASQGDVPFVLVAISILLAPVAILITQGFSIYAVPVLIIVIPVEAASLILVSLIQRKLKSKSFGLRRILLVTNKLINLILHTSLYGAAIMLAVRFVDVQTFITKSLVAVNETMILAYDEYMLAIEAGLSDTGFVTVMDFVFSLASYWFRYAGLLIGGLLFVYGLAALLKSIIDKVSLKDSSSAKVYTADYFTYTRLVADEKHYKIECKTCQRYIDIERTRGMKKVVCQCGQVHEVDLDVLSVYRRTDDIEYMEKAIKLQYQLLESMDITDRGFYVATSTLIDLIMNALSLYSLEEQVVGVPSKVVFERVLYSELISEEHRRDLRRLRNLGYDAMEQENFTPPSINYRDFIFDMVEEYSKTLLSNRDRYYMKVREITKLSRGKSAVL